MSAAINEKMGEEDVEQAIRDQRGRKRETHRRQVVTLPDDIGYWLRREIDAGRGFANLPQAIRFFMIRGMKADGVSLEEIRAIYKKHLAEVAHAEAEKAFEIAEAATASNGE